MSDKYQPALVGAEIQKIEEQANNEASRVAVEQVAADWDQLKKVEKDRFVKAYQTKLKDDDLTIFSVPRKGCAHCHGTGVEGAYTNESVRLPGQPCLCRCLTNRLIYHPWQPDPNRLTYKEFKNLMSLARQRYNLKEPEDESSNKVDVSSIQGTSEEDGARRDEEQTIGDYTNVVG